MDYLHPPVSSICITTGTDCNQRSTIIPLLCLQLMQMTKACRRPKTFRDTEFPFKPLPFIPIPIQSTPFVICLRLHFIPLTIAQQATTVTIQRFLTRMINKSEGILLYFRIPDNFAMSTLPMILLGTIGMF